jgi:hypothetical protein
MQLVQCTDEKMGINGWGSGINGGSFKINREKQ